MQRQQRNASNATESNASQRNNVSEPLLRADFWLRDWYVHAVYFILHSKF